jgi:pyridoxamine 5'-phosphate oxidase family protein
MRLCCPPPEGTTSSLARLTRPTDGPALLPKLQAMSAFTDRERAYLTAQESRLGRVATVGRDGTPHVAPVGWSYNAELDTIDIGGRDFGQSKKYRDVQRTGRAAIVVDDLASVDPWRPRAVEVRGRAEAVVDPAPLIRIHPDRVVSWGLDDQPDT